MLFISLFKLFLYSLAKMLIIKVSNKNVLVKEMFEIVHSFEDSNQTKIFHFSFRKFCSIGLLKTILILE